MNKKNIANFLGLAGLGVAGLFALLQKLDYNDTKRYLEQDNPKVAYERAVNIINNPDYKLSLGIRAAAIQYIQTHSQPDSSDTTKQKPKPF